MENPPPPSCAQHKERQHKKAFLLVERNLRHFPIRSHFRFIVRKALICHGGPEHYRVLNGFGLEGRKLLPVNVSKRAAAVPSVSQAQVTNYGRVR